MKTIVLGVCGGIAAYKGLAITSSLKKSGYDVHVIMTKNATEFIKPLSFQSISGNGVITDMFTTPTSFNIKHISLAKKADLLLIVPATANIIDKVAGGIADDMLSTTIMATKATVLFAPAMNTNMYNNPIYKKNETYFKYLGYKFIDPLVGNLACGYIGAGKLPEPEAIVDYAHSIIGSIKDLTGKKILVTAGPTQSKIDPVRYLSNCSSGKMGYAIAREARNRGANITLIEGPTELKKIPQIHTISITSNEEIKKEIDKIYEQMDIVIMAAAVLDYKVKCFSHSKIKKNNETLSLELIKNQDILKTLGEKKSHQLLVGFAAETDHVLDYAIKKLKLKNLDYIIANDITLTVDLIVSLIQSQFYQQRVILIILINKIR